VHEFGHVLGFGHEQDRADNTSAAHETCNPEGSIAGTYVTAYDGQSVMHYCNRGGNVSGWLSNEDKNGVAAAYGARVSPVPPAKYLAADVNGGGRADLIYLWAGGINTLLSSGHGTYPLAAEAWKPRGDYRMDVSTTEWLAADVNGDGRADLLHLWANGINTLLSAGNGTYSLVAEAWKPRTDYTIGIANTRWLAADVNDDGRADLLHLWDGGINTLLSAGNGTYALVAEAWKPRADYAMNLSTTRWLAADMNAAGGADLLHLRYGLINTLVSFGNGTFPSMMEGWDPQPWFDMD
ncbi:MAG TPA: FG-GAP-like repeat-containing protein, partial [Archangium sp.]|nr:FG-GAP-like repeat-containing protein [Archangium sp.]